MTVKITPASKPATQPTGPPTRRIKVLHLITSLEVGGAQHGLLLGLPRFDPDRYEHVVCSLMDRMQMANQFQQAGIEVHSLGLRRKTDLAVALRLRTLLKQLQPDILHTYLLHSNVVGRIVGRLVGTPAIVGSERTIGQARRWGRLATRLTNPLTDAVEVNSETGARAIERDLGVPSEKIEVVRSGIDLDAFGGSARRVDTRSALGIADGRHLVLYVGRLRPVKGIEYGIRAFASATAKHENMHLAMAGEGEQLGYLQDLATKLELGEKVTFLGVRNDLPDLFAAADSVLMPSLNEGFPRTAIEAMAAGKPVIATAVGGTPEAIVDGKTGILVPPKDIEAMVGALVELAGDPELQTRLGAAGRERAMQNYSVENYVARLDGLYRQLLGIANTPTPTSTTRNPQV
ncbi:MAG: glycosyltransferase [Dehalococcoidia bacterium]|jgi:glycosyltransferase involved in cell wall biosynthesis|nr:glycosyltransferase [Dehalococcoidia bacterium]